MEICRNEEQILFEEVQCVPIFHWKRNFEHNILQYSRTWISGIAGGFDIHITQPGLPVRKFHLGDKNDKFLESVFHVSKFGCVSLIRFLRLEIDFIFRTSVFAGFCDKNSSNVGGMPEFFQLKDFFSCENHVPQFNCIFCVRGLIHPPFQYYGTLVSAEQGPRS